MLQLLCTLDSRNRILHRKKPGGIKLLANRSFQSFGKENLGRFKHLTFSYFRESGIWLSKILVDDICLPNLTKFPPTRILHYNN